MGATAEGILLLVFFQNRYKKYERSKKANKGKDFSFSSHHPNPPS